MSAIQNRILRGKKFRPKSILLLGAPYSGKGTICERLSFDYEHDGKSFYQFSSGEAFRNAAKEQSEFGRNLATLLATGSLVDDNLTMQVVRKQLMNLGSQGLFEDHYLLADGVIRTVPQVELFEEFANIVGVLYPNASDEILERRGKTRYEESLAKYYAHPTNNSLPRPEDEDKPKRLKRIAIYYEKTAPLVDLFRQRGILYEIDASKSKEEVYSQTVDSLEKMLKQPLSQEEFSRFIGLRGCFR